MYYTSCQNISIYLFHKIMETGNYAFMVKGWDEVCNVEKRPWWWLGKVADLKKAEEAWAILYEQYTELTGDNRSLIYYKLVQRIAYLEKREFICSKIVLMLYLRDNVPDNIFYAYLDQVKRFGFSYDKKRQREEIITKLLEDIKFSKNEIGIKRSELEAFSVKGDPIPLMKQVVMAEAALGKNTLDPKKTSVEKWVFYMEQIRETNKQRKKVNG